MPDMCVCTQRKREIDLGICGRIRARIFPTQAQSHGIQIQDLLR